MPKGQIVPLILVGVNRSGTKWLSNILCNHSDVAGIQSEHHTGLIENNFRNMQQAIGDLSRPDNYVALIELWSQTDFFSAAGTEKELFYRCSPRPTTLLGVFELLLNDLATRRKAGFWQQKMSPASALEVTPSLKNGPVIIIRRKLVPTLESTLEGYRRKGIDHSLFTAALSHGLQVRLLEKLRRKTDVVSVDYEKLRVDTENEVRRICDRVGLQFEPAMLTVSYRRNTSFPSGRVRVLTRRDRVLAYLLYALSRCAPLTLLQWLKKAFGKGATGGFVRGTFGDIKRRYNID